MSGLASAPAVNLFARHSIDQGVITTTRQRAAKAVQQMARGTNATANILYRALRATDVNGGTTVIGHLTNPATLAANTYSASMFANFATGQNQAFAIFGIVLYNSAPLVDEMTIKVGAATVAILPLGEIKASGSGTTPQVGIISEPIWVPPQTSVTVTMLSGAAQTQSTENFDLLGYVGEPVDATVSKQAVVFN